MIAKQSTQKHRKEKIEQHGNQGGFYLEIFDENGKPGIIIETYCKKDELDKILELAMQIQLKQPDLKLSE